MCFASSWAFAHFPSWSTPMGQSTYLPNRLTNFLDKKFCSWNYLKMKLCSIIVIYLFGPYGLFNGWEYIDETTGRTFAVRGSVELCRRLVVQWHGGLPIYSTYACPQMGWSETVTIFMPKAQWLIAHSLINVLKVVYVLRTFRHILYTKWWIHFGIGGLYSFEKKPVDIRMNMDVV